jgi:hypothetical protein
MLIYAADLSGIRFNQLRILFFDRKSDRSIFPFSILRFEILDFGVRRSASASVEPRRPTILDLLER